MKKLSEIFSLRERCWPGYKPTPGKKAYDKGSCVKEASAAAIAAATAISKKKSGNYDKKGFRKTPYKNPDHPNVKSNEQRRKEINEDFSGDNPQQVAGSAQSTLTDKPNREPMKTYKQKNITELSTELLHRYKEKASADSTKADKEGDIARGNKRFSGVVKATNKQFANFKKKGFKEETEQIDEISSDLVAKARDVAFAKGKEKQAFRFVRKHYEKQKKESDAFGKKMAEEVEQIDEKNVPTSPEKWAQAKAQAKAKFDVYPSAYANGWAAKKYKAMGGGWKSVSEAVKDKFDIGEYDQEGDMAKSDLRSIMANAQKLHDMIKDADNLPEWCQNKITLAEDYISTVANYLTAEMNEEWSKTGKEATHRETGEKTYEYQEVDKEGKSTGKREYRNAQGKPMGEATEQLPFEPDKKPKKPSVIAGKYGAGYSTARHLARMAMQKQAEKMKKPIKEEESKKAKIVKDIMKKKKTASEDAFQKDPELSSTLTKI